MANDEDKITIALKIERDLHGWLQEEARRRRSSLAYEVRVLLYDAMEASVKASLIEVERRGFRR